MAVERKFVSNALREALCRARTGERAVLILSGPAGMGKSTALEAFARELEGRPDARVARGGCVEHHSAMEPYLPVLDALGGLARKEQTLVSVLAKHAPLWLADLPGLLDEATHAELTARNRDAPPERKLREMTEALDTLAAERVLVILLEDLHWSDPATCALLMALARRRVPAKLMIVVTIRCDEAPQYVRDSLRELRVQGWARELALTPLSQTGVADLAKELLGKGGTNPDLVRRLYARTGGHPLFLGRILNSWQRMSGFEASGAAEQVLDELVPETIRWFALKRADRLPPELRTTAEIASLAGSEFSAVELAAVLGIELDDAERRCARLAQESTLLTATGTVEWPGGSVATEYRFTHALLQEMLAERVEAGRRVRIQRKLAEVRAVAREPSLEPAREPRLPAANDGAARFVREGEYWTAAYRGQVCRIRDVRGMAIIARLLVCPRSEIHALELAADQAPDDVTPPERIVRAMARQSGTATLDRKARASYAARVRELEAELDRAIAAGEFRRAAKAEEELEFLKQELGRATGLFGRERATGTPAERARVNVTRAIKSAIRKIEMHHPLLAEHLSESIHTGTFCSYAPRASTPIDWCVEASG